MPTILTLVHDAHEVLDFVDHPTDRGRVLDYTPTSQLVKPKSLDRKSVV